MRVGPKYKIARRLGAHVFEKTQSPKFAVSEQKRKRKFSRPGSVFSRQLLEKQRVRLNYGLSEKQFSNYVKKSIASHQSNAEAGLYQLLETRLDSALLRAGFAITRGQARQIANHGHCLVNGTRVDIPSYVVKQDDVITLRDRSAESELFRELASTVADTTVPAWLKVDGKKKSITVDGTPDYTGKETPFDFGTVLQFYKR